MKLKQMGIVGYAEYFRELYYDFKKGGPVFELRNKGKFNDCYSVISIKKKSGGQRIITVPNQELKSVQRKIAKLFERALLINDSKKKSYILSDGHRYVFQTGANSYGFEKNKNIFMNAQRHMSSKYFFKTDIHHFFDSFDYYMVKKIVHQAMQLNEESIRKQLASKRVLKYEKIYIVPKLLHTLFKKKSRNEYFYEDYITALLCYNGKLATGSPASPALSNLYMRAFDKRLEVWLRNQEIKKGQSFVYTRYADDITISSDKKIPKNVYIYVQKLLNKYKLEIKEEKTHFQSAKSKNVITGINVTCDGKLTVGRKKKEEFKKMLYDYVKSSNNAVNQKKVFANISYVFSIEPDYCIKMLIKYSNLENIEGKDLNRVKDLKEQLNKIEKKMEAGGCI